MSLVLSCETSTREPQRAQAKRPTFIDLFSGCGGASVGFLMAGFDCLLAVDNYRAAIDNYNRNLRGPRDRGCVDHDLSSIRTHEDAVAFLSMHGIAPGDVDVVVGCPPCQSFSVAGINKIRALMDAGEDSKEYWSEKNQRRNSLFEAVCLIVEVLGPRWVFFENVPAIRAHKVFPEVLGRFSNLRTQFGSELGYAHDQQLYMASDYGVPQSRRRFVLVARREDVPCWSAPSRIPEVVTGQALSDLPVLRNGERHEALPYVARAQNTFQAQMRQGLFDPHFGFCYDNHCRTQNTDDVELFRRMAPSARFADPDVQAALREVNPDHKLLKYSIDKFKDKLHRLDADRLAWTVTAHLRRDCYKFIHPWQPRTISVREAARLQSFPDWFRFDVLSMIISFEVIGNAVPPLMARAFAESILFSDPTMAGPL